MFYSISQRVQSVQVASGARLQPNVVDGSGISFGTSVHDLPGEQFLAAPKWTHSVVSHKSRIKRFYGFLGDGQIFRVGLTLSRTELPQYIQWYQSNGRERKRPVRLNLSLTTAIPAAEKIATAERCGFSDRWVLASGADIESNGLVSLTIECPGTGVIRSRYFLATGLSGEKVAAHEAEPHPIATPFVHNRGGLNVSLGIRARPGKAAQTSSHRKMLSSSPLRVWLSLYQQPPNGRRFIYPNILNTEFGYDSTANPTSFDVIVAPGGSTPGADGSTNIQAIARSDRSQTLQTTNQRTSGGGMRQAAGTRRALSGGPTYLAQNCPFGSSLNKCEWQSQPYQTGQVCDQVIMHAPSGDYYSNVGCVYLAVSPKDFSHPSRCAKAAQQGAVGAPIDLTSGSLSYSQTDAALSGPAGLLFAHTYDSSYDTFSGLLGTGWRSTFDSALDLSQIAAGQITFTSECGDEIYFPVPASGHTTYDQSTGATLTLASDGSYSVRFWEGFKYTFSAAGLLIGFLDRVGNQTTLTRQGNAPFDITTATDVLGKSLTFTYDANNRIKTVASKPSGVSLSFTYDSGTNCYTGDLCSFTGSDGKKWTYQYDNPTNFNGEHLLTEVTDPLGHVEENNTWSLISIIDYQNEQTTRNWTAYRITQQAMDGGSRSLSFTYTSNEYYGEDDVEGMTTVIDADNRGSRVTYDMNLQQITSIYGPLCKCGSGGRTYAYDIFGRLINYWGDLAGNPLITYSYDDAIYTAPDNTSYVGLAIPQMSQISYPTFPAYPSSPSTRVVGFTYYPFADPRQDLKNTITQPSIDTTGQNFVVTDTYSSNGLLTNESRAGYSNGLATTLSWSATYDSKGRLQSTTGPRTDVTQQDQYVYFPDTDSDLSRRGQLSSHTDAANHKTAFASAASPNNTYDLYGSPLSITDPNGVTSLQSYDALGRPVKSVLNAAGSESSKPSISWAYDGAGRQASLTSPLGNKSIFGFDNDNDFTTLTLADSAGTYHDQDLLTYDAAGFLSAESKSSCSGTSCSTVVENKTFSYDSQYGDLASVQLTAPTGSQEVTAFSNFNARTGQNQGDLLSEVFKTSSGTELEYDLTHDPYGDLASQSVGASGSSGTGLVQFNYNSHLYPAYVSTRAAAGSVTATYQFDDFDRLITATSPETGLTKYVRDADGNATSIMRSDGSTVSTSFDAIDRVLVQKSTKSGATETVTRTYDSGASGAFDIGRLSSLTDPSGTTTYAYERRGLVATASKKISGTAYAISYSYNDDGDIATISYPSGRVATYNYDWADRPTSVTVSSTSIISTASYLPFGPVAGISYGNGMTQSFGYDARYRPATLKTVGGGGATVQSLTYTYDSANRLSQTTDNLDAGYSVAWGFSPSASSAPQLATFSAGAKLWGSGTATSDPDFALGSMSFANYHGAAHSVSFVSGSIPGEPTSVTVDGKQSTLSYNSVGKLGSNGSETLSYSPREMLSSADGSAYLYDGDSERVLATRGSSKRAYIYGLDGRQQLLAESNLSNSGVSYEYLYLGDRLVAEFTPSATYWVASDQLATPTILTTSSDAVAWQADYEPWGQVYGLRTPDVHEPVRRKGQEAEEFDDGAGPNGETPRYYNHGRWYRPQWGVYESSDPMGRSGTLFDQFTYANNDPIDLTDPSGACVVSAQYDRVVLALFNVPTIGYHESITFASEGQPTYFTSASPQRQQLLNWGDLTAKFALWNPTQTEYRNWANRSDSKTSVLANTGPGDDCGAFCEKAAAYAKLVNNSGVLYDFTGVYQQLPSFSTSIESYANSNTFAFGVTTALGLSAPPPPPGIGWFPGYQPFPPGAIK